MSAAHSGRFACAYLPAGTVHTGTFNAKSVKVAIFECESSGGVEWLLEGNLRIDHSAENMKYIIYISHFKFSEFHQFF